MIESTQQVLLSNLGKVVGPVEADKLLNIWMAKGIATVTAEMTQDFKAACAMKEKRWSFLEKYGHRGPGEMDLTNPRWIELGDKAFVKTTADVSQAHEPVAAPGIEAEIAKVVSGIRLNLVLEEWGMLKKMLELREFGKMATMKSYANIRWLSSEIGRRNGLGDDVFWLRLSEVVQLKSGLDVQEKIKQRKPRFHVFRKLSFPAVVSLSQIAEILQGGDTTSGQKLHAFDGEALSPGLVYGQVRVVEDPTTIDFSDWPEDAILVAEATDPGWTVPFQRVKGIVVERGGVLSHCAILAREMGLPAVSRILNCTQTFKDGDYVWIDGSNGRVTRA